MSTLRPISVDAATTMLDVALAEAQVGLAEGGIPIGAALFTRDGALLGAGRNRRVQHGDASAHAETDAFRAAGRRRGYRDCVMVTTLSPCWYCAGLVRQFDIGAVIVGEATNFSGAHEWLATLGTTILVLDDRACVDLLGSYIARHRDIWSEDIGQ